MKLVNSCSKLKSRLERLDEDTSLKTMNRRQVSDMREAHYDILKMKLRIKNKNADLERLSRLTGELKINPFYLREERNVKNIESSIVKAMKG